MRRWGRSGHVEMGEIQTCGDGGDQDMRRWGRSGHEEMGEVWT